MLNVNKLIKMHSFVDLFIYIYLYVEFCWCI